MIDPGALYAVEFECPRGLAGALHKSLFHHIRKIDSQNVWCLAPGAPREPYEIYCLYSDAQARLNQEVMREMAHLS